MERSRLRDSLDTSIIIVRGYLQFAQSEKMVAAWRAWRIAWKDEESRKEDGELERRWWMVESGLGRKRTESQSRNHHTQTHTANQKQRKVSETVNEITRYSIHEESGA